MFRRKSSVVKFFFSDTHLIFFDVLQVCFNKIGVLWMHWRTTKLQKKKKHFKLNKLIISCSHYTNNNNNNNK